MEYSRIYCSLIERARGRIKHRRGHKDYVYYEKHHIIPKCLGGGDETSNLVYLTAEEHWIAHLLLVKIHPGIGELVYACQAMSMTGGNNQRTNNKLFGWIRRTYAAEVSKRQSGRQVSPETKEKLSIALTGVPRPSQQGSNNVSKRPEIAKKISEAAKGRSWGNHSETAKASISKANKKHDLWLSNSQGKSRIIATPLHEGPKIIIDSREDLEYHGFVYKEVKYCILGKRKIHKNFTFKQEIT